MGMLEPTRGLATGPLSIIVNASAGSDAKDGAAKDQLTEMFRAGGLKTTIFVARDGGEVIAAARRALREKPYAVVAGGGDGTISAAASVLVGTNVALGVLPLGTLNHFAKDLGIPLDLAQATRNIIAGHIKAVDVGEVNGKIFLNNSGLGLYPSIVRYRKEQQQRLGRGKWPAFAWAVLTALRRYPFLNVRLSVDDKEISRKTPFVFIGNNEYEMESLNVGTRSCLDGGNLSLYMAQRPGRLGLLRLALRALFRRLRAAKDFDAFCAKEISIETRRERVHVAIDGEVVLMDTPLRYRVRPRALRVIVLEQSK